MAVALAMNRSIAAKCAGRAGVASRWSYRLLARFRHASTEALTWLALAAILMTPTFAAGMDCGMLIDFLLACPGGLEGGRGSFEVLPFTIGRREQCADALRPAGGVVALSASGARRHMHSEGQQQPWRERERCLRFWRGAVLGTCAADRADS